MASFTGILGDWHTHPSEFSLERALSKIGDLGVVDTQIEVVDPLSGAITAHTDGRVALGLALSNVAVPTRSVTRRARHGGGEIITVLSGRLTNRSTLAGDLAIEPRQLLTLNDADLLAAAYRQWGVNGFVRILGSYAGAVLDVSARKLHLATDHFGTWPLFYGCLHDQLVFGTSLGALTALVSTRPTFDAIAVRSYLTQSIDPSDRSMVRGIKRLLPGQVASHSYGAGQPAADPRAFKLSTYWRAQASGDESSVPLREALSRFRGVLYESTRRSTEGAQSPIIGLSGGLYSSSVLFAGQHASGAVAPVPALHLTVSGGGSAASQRANLAARAVGSDVQKLEISQVDGQDIEAIARLLSDPLTNAKPITTYRLLKEARSLGHSTVLTGTGATGCVGTDFLSWSLRLAKHLVAGEVLSGLRYAWSLRKIAGLRRLTDAAITIAWPAEDAAKLPLAGTPEYFATPSDASESSGMVAPAHSPDILSRRLQLELETASTLATALVIEHDAPLVSVELAEATNAVWARELERTGLAPMGLLVESMRGIVPNEIIDEAAGPSSPLLTDHEILAQKNDWVWAMIQDDSTGDLPLQAQILRESWLLMRQRKAVYDPAVWRWINLAIWARAHRVSFG